VDSPLDEDRDLCAAEDENDFGKNLVCRDVAASARKLSCLADRHWGR
jgi:hypothetical protein